MMRADPKVKVVYLYPKPVDFRKSINGLAALVELDIKVAVFDPVLFVFLNRRGDFFLCLREPPKTHPLPLKSEPPRTTGLPAHA